MKIYDYDLLLKLLKKYGIIQLLQHLALAVEDMESEE